MKPRLNRKTCAAILKDEKEASAMYKKMGFPKQSKDEANHYRFFKTKCRRTK